MGIKTQKVLRLISKIILILVGVGLVGIAGYYVYKSIAFKPQNVVVTNITDGSATVTWTTSSPMKGIVYVKKDKALLPGPLGIIGSSMAYDDRDVSDAQKDCVDTFNKKASETKDSTFSVSGSNFDCENIKVIKTGSYYTHSVTMTNLDENSTYNFVVGDGIWSFKESVSIVKTFTVLETVGEPMPVFGRIMGEDGTYSRDSIVYITFNDGSESKDSIVYCSAVNDDGGWYVDASSIRDVNGNILPLELSNDTFRIKGIYSNYGKSDEVTHIFGVFQVDTFDIVVKKTNQVSVSAFDKLVMGVYAGVNDPVSASVCPKCPSWMTQGQVDAIKAGTADVSAIGYGNVLKVLAGSDGVLSTAESKLLTAGNNSGVASDIGYVATQQGITVEQPKCPSCTTGQYCSSSTNYKCVGNTAGGSTPAGEQGNTSNTNTQSGCIMMAGNNAIGRTAEGSCYGNQICKDGVLGGTCTPDVITSCSDGTPINTCKKINAYSSHYCQSNGTFGGTDNNSIDCGKTKVNTLPAIASTETCNVVAEFNNRGDLASCSIKCNDKTSVGFNQNNCLNLLPNKEEITDPSSADYAYLREGTVLVSEINLEALSSKSMAFLDLVKSSEGLKEIVWKDITEMESEATNSLENTGKFTNYCDAVGGTMEAVYPYKCTPSSTQRFNIFGISKVYAADTSSSSYTFFMPDYGMYSFELGDYTFSKNVSDGNTVYLFYVEANDVKGFQMPVDPDNPTSEEDIVLSSSASEITYKQESTAQQYEIKKGINIISFDFVPVSTDTGAYTAKDVISQALDNGVEVQYISTFEGGRWNSGYSCSSDTCTGNNFTIVPGKGYLVYATQDGTVTIPGYNLTSSVPVAFSAGWNLVGVHGYTTAYTARSFIDSVNTIEGLTANNVSWWPTSKSKYEGVEVDNGTQYGLDFSISPNNGYFVRISKFAPTDTKCKSLIWNAGGSLNGTCGNTK